MPIHGLTREDTLPAPLTDTTYVADSLLPTLDAEYEAARAYMVAHERTDYRAPNDPLTGVVRAGWREVSNMAARIRRAVFVRDTGMDAEGGVFAFGPVASHWPMSAVVDDADWTDRDALVTLFLPPTIVDRGTYPATDYRDALDYEYLNLPYVGKWHGPQVDLDTRADDRDGEDPTLYVCACESHHGQADHPSVGIIASAYDAGGGCDTDYPCQECWDNEDGSGYVSVTVPQSIARFILAWWPYEDVD